MKMLQGIHVLEFADGLVDLGGRMLAELGADVTSIAEPHSSRTREQELAWGHGKTRLPAEHLTNQKRTSLIAEADIVLDGRRTGPGSEIDNLSDLYPRIIHVIARPFSADGPYRNRPATNLNLMALSGLMTIIGEPDRPPLCLPGEQAYALTGIQAATAALLGLYARRQSGKGQRIELSAFQAATLANYREALMFEWTGRIGHRTGNKLVRGKSGVRQIWPCADGFVTWSMIDNPSMMRAVVRVMEEQGVAGELSDIDWDGILVADTDQRIVDRWQSVYGAFFSQHHKARLADWSLKHGWGLSAISDMEEVRQSEHLAERGLFVPVVDTDTGNIHSLPGPLFVNGKSQTAPERVLSPIQMFERSFERALT